MPLYPNVWGGAFKILLLTFALLLITSISCALYELKRR